MSPRLGSEGVKGSRGAQESRFEKSEGGGEIAFQARVVRAGGSGEQDRLAKAFEPWRGVGSGEDGLDFEGRGFVEDQGDLGGCSRGGERLCGASARQGGEKSRIGAFAPRAR